LPSAALLVLVSACDPEPEPALDPEFDDAYDVLADGYGGGGKADLFEDLGLDRCSLLAPLASHFDELIKAGFFVGVSANRSVGPITYNNGYDIVFDLYHHQMTVSAYQTEGLRTGLTIGGGASAYFGAAFNFQRGAAEWNGYFVTTEATVNAAEIVLPVLAALPIDIEASVTPSVFVSGEDPDGDGIPTPIYPDGVYGFGIALGVGGSLSSDVLPVPALPDVSATQGLWAFDAERLREMYDRLEGSRLFGISRPLEAKLLDAETGEDCLERDPDWPSSDDPPQCVLQFGDPNDSHLRQGLSTALAICELTGDCSVPLAWPFAGLSLAIGSLRDAGEDLQAECGIEPERRDAG